MSGTAIFGGPVNDLVYDADGSLKVTGAGMRIGFETTDTLNNGIVYDSPVLKFEDGDYSQVQTEVLASHDGTMLFRFYADDAGTDLVRSLTVPYNAADGYRQFGAPTFGRSVRYRFTNDSGTNQTDFYFITKLLRGAASPQQVALDAFVSPTMLAAINRSVLTAQNPSGAYGNVQRSAAGELQVAITNPLTGFGELRTASVHPIVQQDAIYGITEEMEQFVDASPGTGSTTAPEGNFTCKTGVGVGGYGVIRTQRAVRYRPGQGSLFRFTAFFSSPVALSLQAAGAFNSSNGFLVGYNGTSFGVMHRTNGRHEIRTLTITVAAGGAETANIELNGVTYNIPVTAGSVQHNAFEIEQWLNDSANQTIWEAEQTDDIVKLFNTAVAPASGAYSVASTGTFAGAIIQDGAGVVNTETWTTQANFSIDSLDGTGPSGMILDPTKGNVYEIDLQYLGYGAVEMKIEEPTSGRFFTFHRHAFANALTEPTLKNPTLKIGWIAASLGSTTDLTVGGASCMGAVDGFLHPLTRPRAHAWQETGVGSTLTSIFSIRVRNTFKGVVQLSEVLPKIVYVSPEGTKACEVDILLNPTFDAAAAETNWQYIDEDNSIIEYDQTATTMTKTGTLLASFIVAGGTTEKLDFTALAEQGIEPIHLERGDILCIAAKITGGGGSNVTASLTWLRN